ncbi:putative short chain dehydrogenase [Stipitochalara longipes BDJ]|nr:putative short chain dehydrogenase [Stipitochalara longipes BDJ]
MPSYLVTGGSRGIGFELVRQLSASPENVVVTIVRNKIATESKFAAEIPGRKNVFVLQGDLTNEESLKVAFAETKKITGDSLDVLIANAGLISGYSQFLLPSELIQDPKATDKELNDLFQVNVVGNIRLFNIFLPLIKNGKDKKVVTISSGNSVVSLTVEYALTEAAPYSISKAAMNMVVAKFQAEFKKEGILFMAVCPGAVNTGQFDNQISYVVTEKDMQGLVAMSGKFAAYAPDFKGPASPDEAVRDVLSVIENATLEANGGKLVSHFGNQQYL